jgi:hypothetical protein
MRVLLLHPDDSPRRGPWSQQHWDLVVDLGKSSHYSVEAWSAQFSCPVLGADSFRYGVADVKIVRQILARGRGRLIDEEGIDWWDLTSLLLAPAILDVLAFQRVAAETNHFTELWSTRPGWPARVIAILLNCTLKTFNAGRLARLATGVGHYAGLARQFSLAQIKEIFFDKYDSGYQWRSRFSPKPTKCVDPVVLLPSAYGNASRMGADYARMLPQQPFLMVATRENAKQFTRPSNVQVRDLAAYARSDSSKDEISSLMERWLKLRSDLCATPELQALCRVGILDALPMWLRNGISARDAWKEVLDCEPVCGVLCGDDSNFYTRLPVLLAAARKIPTVDFHHGAFDGRYLLKDLPCDVYLAKNQMEQDYLLRVCGLSTEKVVIAAPDTPQVSTAISGDERRQRSMILFSEPYEAVGMRGEEVYRELIPSLLRVAHENDRELFIKLHPFESITQRKRLLLEILGPAAERVTMLDGPLAPSLIVQAWCGITVESTTVMDCLQNGVCCFLCGWLKLSAYEYVQQYARFGMGEVLHNLEQIQEIPTRVADFAKRPAHVGLLATPADPPLLQKWLTSGLREPSGVRSAS